MKVACVAPAHPYRGGIAHFAARLARRLSRDHELLFVNFSRLYPSLLFPGRTQYDRSSVPVDHPSERLLDSLNPFTWRSVGKRIRDWGADAVIFHWWHPFFGPAYRGVAGVVGGSALKVAVCHNVLPHETGAGTLRRRTVSFGLARCDGLVVHGRSERDDVRSLHPSKPVEILFHPIYDVFPGGDTPREAARERLGIAEDARMVLNFGLVRPYKGVDVLLEAAAELGDLERLRVFVVGEVYSGRRELEGHVRRAPPGMVSLIDRYVPNEEVALWFRAADLVALPYTSATQSGIVPIAYRCGRPVLVTSVGGLPDVVEQDRTGYLVPPRDPHALALAVRRHFVELDNPDYADGIAAQCRRLSWDAYAVGLMDFIRRLATERR